MALPATGSTISISTIRNYFVAGGFASYYSLGLMGDYYIGIALFQPVSMSASFGGYYFPIPEG